MYVEPAEPNLQPHIIYIERLWQDDTGQAQFCFNETKSVLICETSYFQLEFCSKQSLHLHLFFTPLLNSGEKWLYGCWFYRPNETFHLATRKFLEKEVFKSDYYNKAPISKILGKCVVMFVKVKTIFVSHVCFWLLRMC